ncbi:MAG TPA: response regulator, partial [Desulfobacteraceae bacterium]|nr:response regulator [Desulfobacteraceae bacterium]
NSGQGVFFAENLGPGFEPDQFMVMSRKGVDNVLYRKEIPVAYRGEHAIMIVLMDVTMLEVARKQKSQARDEKSEFLTRISHEIRTPLNGIIGMVDMLLKKENDDETQKIISLVKNSSDLLQEIINDLLDFSKLDEGNMVLDEIPYDVRKEIDYCFDVAGTQAKGNVNMKHKIASSVPESVIGDPFRLRQVLTNLLSISLEHTDEGEVILEVGSENAGPGMVMLNFDLKDTGKGYDGMVLKKMFGDYIKTENKSISQYGSKGLGSILTKQLIEMMGGTITPSVPSGISDDPDAPGACFSFGVKVYSNIRTDKKYDAERVRKFSDIKTLVVSGGRQRDEELLGNLHKSGLTSYVTSWQKQTVNLIKSNLEQLDDRYKLIIIVDSPDFDGFEVAETLYREELYKNFLIIMVSSNDKRGNYARCIKYGIDDYIVKPYNNSELLNNIKNGFPGIKVAAGPGLPDLKEKDLSVLVVEDNLISQKVAATILSSIGLEADLASNGIEGLEKAAGRKYDIIFMDLIMPEMDGYTASKKILETSPDTLIIALSADISSESAKKAEIAGIREVVNKPVKKEDIEGVFIKYFSR